MHPELAYVPNGVSQKGLEDFVTDYKSDPNRNGPPPGTYSPTLAHYQIANRFGDAAFQGNKKPSFADQSGDPVPGPGTYMPRPIPKKNNPAVCLVSRDNRFRGGQVDYQKPGPAAYTVKVPPSKTDFHAGHVEGGNVFLPA